MVQSLFNGRHISVHQKRLRHSPFLWHALVVVLMACQKCDAQNHSSIHTVLAHPAMFGSPWTGVITAAVLKTTRNLCDGNLESITEIINFNSSKVQAADDQQYDLAIFYDDPDVQGWRSSCEYSQMAQVVERLYPSAKYLLISNDSLNALRKRKDEPDTNLSLASVILQDVYVMNEMFQNETAIPMTIDAYTRAFVGKF